MGSMAKEKMKKEKRRENYPCNLVETALAACDVSTICNLADYLQVHSAVGMDHGISGGKTCDICTSDLGREPGLDFKILQMHSKTVCSHRH